MYILSPQNLLSATMKNLFASALLAISMLFSSCSKDSDNGPEPDTTAPQVSFTIAGITNTGAGTPVVSNQIQINVSASDAGGIQKIEAFINNEKKGEDTSAPYQLTIDVTGYASKGASSGKYQDYQLRVVATDLSGNVSTQELTINIDNELPVIADVSLNADTVLAGDTNEVSFTASDNEALTALEVYLNDQLLETFTDSPFAFNINTLALEDGPNTARIRAEDAAGNATDFEIAFFADNTGPEISLESIQEGQLIDSLITFAPVVTDAISSVVSFTALLNGVELLQSDGAAITALEIDPETLSVGEVVFTLTAEDELGNTTEITVNTEVKRRLLAAFFEPGFLKSNWYGFWVLVSNPDGTPIILEQASSNVDMLKIYAPGEFPIDQEFMVSFIADEDMSGWIKTHMTVVQDLTRTNLQQIHFKTPYGTQVSGQTFPLTGFFGVEIMEGRGLGQDYQAYVYDNDVTQFRVEQYSGIATEPYEQFYVAGYEFGDTPNYAYAILDNPIANITYIDRSDFISAGLISGTSNFSGNANSNADHSLYLYGYLNATEREKGHIHLIFDTDKTFGPLGIADFTYPDIFESYEHHFRLGNYNTYRQGLPTAQYTVPDWTISYIQNGNEITLTSSGTGHTVGRLIADIGGPNNSQLMTLIFDSSNPGPIYLPQLPAELSNLNAYTIFQSGQVSVDYAELVSFDTLPSYTDYLQGVISQYKEHREAAPVMESVLSTNGFIFSNWSFKYE